MGGFNKYHLSNRMETFTDNIDVLENGCWQWIGHIKDDGYVDFWVGFEKQNKMKAHRFSYFIYIGEIPKGLQLDHLCKNRSCVNPEHLEAVTPRENTFRSPTASTLNAKKTHCPRGHVYDKIKPNGYRLCTQCVKYWNNMKTLKRQELRSKLA